MLFRRSDPSSPSPARDRRLRGAIAALALLLAWVWAGSARAEAPRLFVVDLSREQLPAPYQDLDLAGHVGRSLTAEGCQVDRACQTEACLKESAASGVHLLTFQVSYDRERYACAVAVEVRDRAEGRLLYKESSSSPVCPAADLLDHTSKAARVACGELKRTPAGSTPSPLELTSATAPTAPRPAARGRALAAGLVGLGVGSLAAGGALLYFDGSKSRCQLDEAGKMDCPYTRRTTKVAVPLILVGALLSGWGTYRLIGTEQRGVTVGLGPQGLLVGGRFQ
jgi:hypothetical protein